MFNLERTDIPNRMGKPWEHFQRHYRGEEIGQIVRIGRVQAALPPHETESRQHISDIEIGLCHPSGVMLKRIGNNEVESNGKHQEALSATISSSTTPFSV
jgi:hypothetical protein